ncbi:MAG TPA: diguanylate cyclase [Solirubrobacterales bacterium]|nr:diguanylate cyclase [Solirubrobacterales bacterium]
MASDRRSEIKVESRAGTAAGQLAREVSSLQAVLLARLDEELNGVDAPLFAQTACRLAQEFGSVTATAIEALSERAGTPPVGDPLASLFRPGQMRRRLDQMLEMNRRYGHPFGLVVFAIEGPGARNGADGGRETALAVVGAALRESIRLVDEVFPLEEDALCVLAPNQTTVEGVQMTERLLRLLDELEGAGGLSIGVSAGVVACPEHGAEAERLLHDADEAMWRARAVGQPVGVGSLQDR